jgi:hypothetical protein
VVATLALILGLISIGVFLFRQNVSRTGPGVNTASPTTAPPIDVTTAASTSPAWATSLAAPTAVVTATAAGDCLTWRLSGTNALDIHKVPCAQPHRGQVTKVIDLTGRFHAWPGQASLNALTATDCVAALPERLAASPSELRPQAGSLYDGNVGWRGAPRVLVCILRNGIDTEWVGSAT